MALHVIRATTSPSSAPTDIGQHYINTITGANYISTGTNSVADWKPTSALTNEEIQDIIGPMFQGSSPITATYNDAANLVQLGINLGLIDHAALMNVGTNSHYAIDTHLANTNNPHSVTKTQIGLGQCDNTSDANKPISNATQNALNLKENVLYAGDTSQYYRGDKTWAELNKAAVGLVNCDNTSDLLKPISNATQTALNLKYDSSNPNGYETPTQLNARDTNNRNRSNHTGTQTASTISDFSTAADARITAQKAVANGIASLDSSAKVPTSQIPALPYASTTHTHLSTDITDFTEASQDVVGNILTTTTHDGISVAYNDVSNSLSLTNADKGSSAITSHLAATDPHTQYLKTSTAASTYQPIDSDLTALAALASTGLISRTATGTATTRTITPGTGISISNGDGVSGNPVISSTITQYTDEMAQDATASLITGTSHDGIATGYNDVANTLTFANTDKGSVAISSHVSAIDPHTQYHNDTRGDARYSLLGHTHAYATTTTSGFMSAPDKVKLDGLSNDVVIKSNTTYTNSSNVTYVTCPELAVNCIAGKLYKIKWHMRHTSAATTTGFRPGLNGTAVGTVNFVGSVVQSVTASTTNIISGPLSGYNTNIPATSSAGTQETVCEIEGLFICTTSGLIYPQFLSEVSGSLVSVLLNSICIYKEI